MIYRTDDPPPARADTGFLCRHVATSATMMLFTALLLGSAPFARAGNAPTGWTYPWACCSGLDCRPVSTQAISVAPQGYVIKATGERLPYSDERIKYSPDGDYHWCSVDGGDNTGTICLFVPPSLF